MRERLLLVSLVAGLATACTDVEVVEPGGPGDRCRDRSECREGLRCRAGSCVVPADADGGVEVAAPEVVDASSDVVDASPDGRRDAPPTDAGDDAMPRDLPSETPTGGGGDAAEVRDVPSGDAELPEDVDGDAAGDGGDAVPDGDVGDAAGEIAEPAPDVPDVADDVADVVGPDAAGEVADGGGAPDASDADGPDAADGDAADASDLPGEGEPCVGPCQLGLVCMPNAEGPATCQTRGRGLCRPCEVDTDCPADGAECLDLLAGGRVCGAPCQSADDCPPQFDCDSGGQCRPTTGVCRCTEELVDFTLGCVNEGPDGACAGETVCGPDGWEACTAEPPKPEQCNGADDDCDGATDEAPVYEEAGAELARGDDCGLGACAGGEVVCTATGGVTCSTAGFVTEEDCDDEVDDDCDGIVNEGCLTEDTDGDGVPDDEDCRPEDAAFHAGAPEPCCDPDATSIEDCDRDCDGEVTDCEDCDGDLDGFCPPDDCDDADPTVYPGAPESCGDGVDRNCDGVAPSCGEVADADGDGWIDAGDCAPSDPDVHPGAEERCNDVDDDCDGLTDEGNPGGGEVCGTGEAYCSSGTRVCTHYDDGAAVQCQGAVVEGPERCNGVDDDCDGATDEAFPELGTFCDGPDADQCANGTVVCGPEGEGTVCRDDTPSGLQESCNGADDDCDGLTDEWVCPLDDLDGDGFTADEDCDDLDAGIHPGAEEPCCPQDVEGVPQEVCDRDCDGSFAYCADEDADGDGFTADEDCDDADPTIHPGAPEKCGDGVDQDCDGEDLDCGDVTDADGDGYGASVDCADDDADRHPRAPEACNGVDDDCDGATDEGNPTSKEGACAVDAEACGPGTWVCVHDAATDGVAERCVTDSFQAPEACNGVDDDCDGATDEAFPSLGEPCDGPDEDACENGELVCAADGEGVVCGEESPSGLEEACNNVDDDCDGAIDEGVTWSGTEKGKSCDGIGACGEGQVICNASGDPTCSTNPDGPFSEVSTETCDGVDDDCDGATDEDFTVGDVPVGNPCEGEGACGAGVVECATASKARCSTGPGGSESETSPEVCNGADDDCDGATDEGLGLDDSPCATAGVCDGGGVGASCTEGTWSCDYGDVADYEEDEATCDGLDNDCDGATDEGFDLDGTCGLGQCAGGSRECTPDGEGTHCASMPAGEEQEVAGSNDQSTVEICNGLDDDCDGDTDELSLDSAEQACETAGLCSLTAAIEVSCEEGEIDCDYSQIAGWEEEESACDGLDNDCDGATDEGLTLQGQPIGAPCEGTGACSQGEVQCHPEFATVICSTEPGGDEDQSVPEACSGADEDCDGATDEGFGWGDEALEVGASCEPPGACGVGTVECAADGEAAVCSTGPEGSADESSPEVCNGVDDDCDGATDETDSLDTSQMPCPTAGVCSGVAELVTCSGGDWDCHLDEVEGWEEKEASCDELDNDCDGATDEELGEPGAEKGGDCDGPDADRCKLGTWTCEDPETLGPEETPDLVCEGDDETFEELCDGEDNDCDGVTDEGYPIAQTCDGTGACGIGSWECADEEAAEEAGAGVEPGSVICSTEPGGSEAEDDSESCNDADDDCDGTTDEDFAWTKTEEAEPIPVGEPCEGVGACGEGEVVCSPDDAEPTCSTQPDGTEPGDEAESCNGIDDDCDGKTDETFPDQGEPCDDPVFQDGCRTGELTCVEGEVICADDPLCPSGTQCEAKTSGDQCVCYDEPCSADHGDSCNADGCSCAGGEPCNPPDTTCDPDAGCQ